MSVKPIADIRLYESATRNILGNPIPTNIGKIYQFDDMDCLDVIERLLFLLRSEGFGFDGFDHLYLNLTPVLPHEEIQDSDRSTIKEFSWYHYVDVGCDAKIFNTSSLEEKISFVIESIRRAAMLKAPEDKRAIFEESFKRVLQEGKSLLIPYKRKEDKNIAVEIFTRIDDELSFIPLIRVTDTSGVLKAKQELRCYGRDEFISQIGTITLGTSSARIQPRKNSTTDYYELTPIKIKW